MAIRCILGAVVVSLVLVGPAGSAGPAAAQAPPPVTVDRSIVDGSAQQALRAARKAWQAARIRSYDYEVRRTCFCPDVAWHRVKVRRGVPTKGTMANLAIRDSVTVGRLFGIVQKAISGDAHKLTVRYGRHGVPTRISIDPIQYAIDDEVDYSIRRFTRR